MHEGDRLDALARDVLRLSRNTLLVNLRFLDAALHQLRPLPMEEIGLATEGEHLFYTPLAVLRDYRKGRAVCVRNYLHMVLHGVFRHMYVHTLVDRDCWDLSCDVAVENAITELGLESAAAPRQEAQREALKTLKKAAGRLTAEILYRYFLDAKLPPEEMAALRELFRADDHRLWYLTPEERAAEDRPAGEDGEESAGGEDRWEEISRRMQVDMETFSREQGGAAELMQNLREVNRERYDYAEFLRKFAVRGEQMKLSGDEFDYIFYTYGLRLYRNLPLVEPLEYRDEKKIRELVIAIDTSRSTSGALVQAFLQKTYNILESTESFFERFNLRILQCDEELREDAKITGRKDMEEYLGSMTIRGLQGTDFRPVFRHVEELRRGGEFKDLRGLLYFTDGQGIFPAHKPDYDTAFVFVDEGAEPPAVPPWAIRLVLRREDLEED